jgi:hypothetical protein
MRNLFTGLLLFALSTVGWSDIITPGGVDQSMSAPIELAAFNISLSQVIPVNVSVTYTDLDISPFLARLAVNEGSGWNLGAVGMCDILVNPGSSSGSCTATAGFLPDDTKFQVGFEMFDPTAPTHQLGNPASGFWHVTDVSVTPATTMPEPSTACLLLLAVVATAWVRRRYAPVRSNNSNRSGRTG